MAPGDISFGGCFLVDVGSGKSVVNLAIYLVDAEFIGRDVVEIEDFSTFGLGNEYSDGLHPSVAWSIMSIVGAVQYL